MKRILLFANGELNFDADSPRLQSSIQGHDFILCADGGANHAMRIGIVPNEVIGDLDSLSDQTYQRLLDNGVSIVRHPVDKSSSDLELSLLRAAELGAAEITLLGALGGRLDHLLFNLQLFLHPELIRIHFSLLSDSVMARCIRPGASFRFSTNPGEQVSLLPLSDQVRGVVSEGLLYPLEVSDLERGRSLSLSNQATAHEAQVSVQEGHLLLIHTF